MLIISIKNNQFTEPLNFVFPAEANEKSPWENPSRQKAQNFSILLFTYTDLQICEV